MINVFKKIWSFSIKEKGNLQKSIVIGFLNAIFNSLLVTALYVVLKAIVENSVSTIQSGRRLLSWLSAL